MPGSRRPACRRAKVVAVPSELLRQAVAGDTQYRDISLDEEGALAAADRADEALKRGDPVGPLHGARRPRRTCSTDAGRTAEPCGSGFYAGISSPTPRSTVLTRRRCRRRQSTWAGSTCRTVRLAIRSASTSWSGGRAIRRQPGLHRRCIVQRLRRRRLRWPRLRLAGLRHRRLGPPAGGHLRRRRAFAHQRPRQPNRSHAVELFPRQRGTAGADGARLRATDRGHRRRRPARPDVQRPGGSRLRSGHRQTDHGPQDRRADASSLGRPGLRRRGQPRL